MPPRGYRPRPETFAPGNLAEMKGDHGACACNLCLDRGVETIPKPGIGAQVSEPLDKVGVASGAKLALCCLKAPGNRLVSLSGDFDELVR